MERFLNDQHYNKETPKSRGLTVRERTDGKVPVNPPYGSHSGL